MGFVHRFRPGETVELADGTIITLLEAGHRPVVRIETPGDENYLVAKRSRRSAPRESSQRRPRRPNGDRPGDDRPRR